MNSPPRDQRPVLTARQIATLGLAAAGMTDKQVAATLNISERTVRFHLAAAERRLATTGRTNTVAVAIARRLISISFIVDPKAPRSRYGWWETRLSRNDGLTV